jgi:hypothetical protein
MVERRTRIVEPIVWASVAVRPASRTNPATGMGEGLSATGDPDVVVDDSLAAVVGDVRLDVADAIDELPGGIEAGAPVCPHPATTITATTARRTARKASPFITSIRPQ